MRVRRLKFEYSFPAFNFMGVVAMTQAQELQLDDDSYFEQVAWALGVDGNGTFAATQPTGLQIVDQSSGNVFSNLPLQLQNFASNGLPQNTNPQTPPNPVNRAIVLSGAGGVFPLVVPFVWKPSTQIQATMSVPALTLATTSTQIQLTLKGYKLFLPEEQAAA